MTGQAVRELGRDRERVREREIDRQTDREKESDRETERRTSCSTTDFFGDPGRAMFKQKHLHNVLEASTLNVSPTSCVTLTSRLRFNTVLILWIQAYRVDLSRQFI